MMAAIVVVAVALIVWREIKILPAMWAKLRDE